MIEKLKPNEDKIFKTETGEYLTIPELWVPKPISDKINELVDAVNELQTKVNKLAPNINFAQPEVKENMQKPYNEQRWVGCLCKLWTGDGLVRYGILRGVALNRKKTNYPYQALSPSFEHCEPVLPTDNAIYKGGDNE